MDVLRRTFSSLLFFSLATLSSSAARAIRRSLLSQSDVRCLEHFVFFPLPVHGMAHYLHCHPRFILRRSLPPHPPVCDLSRQAGTYPDTHYSIRYVPDNGGHSAPATSRTVRHQRSYVDAVAEVNYTRQKHIPSPACPPWALPPPPPSPPPLAGTINPQLSNPGIDAPSLRQHEMCGGGALRTVRSQ